MVTTYQLICSLMKQENFTQMLKAGIIPIQWVDYKQIYEHYRQEYARGIRHTEAILYTADEFSVSENWVWKVKYKMESEVQ